jgi:hypothetical protein
MAASTWSCSDLLLFCFDLMLPLLADYMAIEYELTECFCKLKAVPDAQWNDEAGGRGAERRCFVWCCACSFDFMILSAATTSLPLRTLRVERVPFPPGPPCANHVRHIVHDRLHISAPYEPNEFPTLRTPPMAW